VEKAIKEVRNKYATRDDDVPGDVPKLLREDGLKIITKLTPLMKLECVPRIRGIYNDCLKEEATSYKMQRPSHSQLYRSYTKDSSKHT